METLLSPLWAKIVLFGLILVGASLARLVILVVGERFLGKKLQVWPDGLSLNQHFFPSFWLFLTMAAVWGALPFFKLSPQHYEDVELMAHLATIITGTWFIARVVTLFRIVLYEGLASSQPHNLQFRTRRTQVHFLEKFFLLVVWVGGISMSLILFDGARRLGASLIASAGLAGIVIGFAAQKSLSNLVAGLQIAFTQPIRIDDVVVVEKEWGQIEEITLTYVIVRLWDLRRLVLPITYFTEKPFENWTRTSSQVIGTVFIYTDYGVPVEEVRKKFHEIVAGSSFWDRRVARLYVTNTSERTIELRGTVSASDADKAFDLRCEVREKLIAYLQEQHPTHLPKDRLEMRTL
ncbi:MAG: mechanosensitive ion channel family protein [Bacteriovoracia bacterium]